MLLWDSLLLRSKGFGNTASSSAPLLIGPRLVLVCILCACVWLGTCPCVWLAYLSLGQLQASSSMAQMTKDRGKERQSYWFKVVKKVTIKQLMFSDHISTNRSSSISSFNNKKKALNTISHTPVSQCTVCFLTSQDQSFISYNSQFLSWTQWTCICAHAHAHARTWLQAAVYDLWLKASRTRSILLCACVCAVSEWVMIICGKLRSPGQPNTWMSAH